MNKKSLSFLENFANTPSFSGREQKAQQLWLDYIRPFACKVDADIVGNARALLNPGKKFRAGIFGHCDEIGLMVTYIDDNGYVHVRQIGDHHPRALPGSFVTIYGPNGPVRGVFGIIASHILTSEQRNKLPDLKEMWIDLGTKNRKESLKLVQVGDFATVRTPFTVLRGKRIVGTGLDNKIGSFVVAEVLRLLQKKKIDVSLYSISAVHEELTSGGAVTSTFDLNLDIAIIVDLAFATDHPDTDKRYWGDIKLGAGPVLSSASILNPLLTNRLRETAEKLKVPYQLFAEGGITGTDSDYIYKVRRGTAVGMVTIPSRYMHTPSEMVDLGDIEGCIKIIAGFIESLKGSEQFHPVRI